MPPASPIHNRDGDVGNPVNILHRIGSGWTWACFGLPHFCPSLSAQAGWAEDGQAQVQPAYSLRTSVEGVRSKGLNPSIGRQPGKVAAGGGAHRRQTAVERHQVDG